MERTKKQHLVPRFYLNKFSDPDGNVWTYFGDGKPRGDKPEATAIEANFYSPIGPDGERFDELEKILGMIESNAAPLWDDICNGAAFKGEERDHLALFLAAQYLRSPSAVRAGAEMMGSMVHHTSQVLASNNEFHNRSIDEYETDTGEAISPETRGKMREFISDPKNYTINVLRSAGLPVLGGVGDLATLFFNMKWVIGHSEDQHLITSDSPVTRTSDPSTHHRFFGDGAFANKTVRVQFPLNPQRIIEMTWRGDEQKRVVAIPKQMAKSFNGLRAAQAERFVYACRKDHGIEKLSQKWLSGKKAPKIVTGHEMPAIEVRRKL